MLTQKHGAQNTPAHSLTTLSFNTSSLWPRAANTILSTYIVIWGGMSPQMKERVTTKYKYIYIYIRCEELYT